jgi:hypothetical protein
MLPFRLLLLLCAASIPSLLSAQSTSPCTWNPDYNGDNAIGISDLLALLSVFEEVDNDDDGIFDSQDDCVGIIDPCGVCNGTGMDADADGICDDADPCVGVPDACGLCNGPGPTFPIIDEIIYATDSVFLPPVGSWYVFTYAVDTLYTYVCPVQGCTDTSATNFNPSAVIEDGSCMYGPAQCGAGYTSATLVLYTDSWGYENYWEIVTSGSGCGVGTVASGGNSTYVGCTGNGGGSGGTVLPSNSIVEAGPFCLVADEEYDLIFVDSYGDGGLLFELYLNGVLTGIFLGTGNGNVWNFTVGD